MSRAPGSLATRLRVSQIAVSLAMAVTMVVVAVVAGPPLFEAHMREAGQDSPEILAHSQEAFNAAGVLALLIGLVIAASGAILVSALVSRRLRGSLTSLGDAAAQISAGQYDHRVERPDSRELATLADSFNTMAGRLDAIEASRRRLLTDLAHEMRTPLASMSVCVESLEDGAMEPGPEAWQILGAQIQRISRLADDVGQVSAAEEGRLELVIEPTDPVDVVEDAVLAARESYDRKHVQLVTRLGHPLQHVAVDRARIQQVLANLLSNALRHTPNGGRVTVSASSGADGTTIEVSDSGEGIAPEHLPHIFERFYRADEARDRDRGGTGVGLAISRAIAEAHGGRLSASSEGPGRGAVLTLWLPRPPEGLPDARAESRGGGAAAR